VTRERVRFGGESLVVIPYRKRLADARG